jgi:hypothetical protein
MASPNAAGSINLVAHEFTAFRVTAISSTLQALVIACTRTRREHRKV